LAALSPSRRSSRLIACSISGRVWESFQQQPFEGRVLAVFERACLLLCPGHRVVALVRPEIGNGPLNIVLESLDPSPRGGQAAVFASLEPGMEAGLGSRGLRIGEMEVRLGGAEIWEPRPDWDRLRRKRRAIEGRLGRVQALAMDQAPEGSLIGPLSNRGVERPDLAGCTEPQDLTGRTGVRGKPVRSGMVAVREAQRCLEAGWVGSRAALQAGGRLLAGLGGGLTPAGDDFLTGVMLWAWLAHPEPQGFCRRLLEASAAHTTMLSAAFLRSAAEGQCSAAWHDLFAALDRGSEQQLAEAVTSVLSFGHTSGADALAGFVGMGLASTQADSSRVVGGS
jgi:hypothetical protein